MEVTAKRLWYDGFLNLITGRPWRCASRWIQRAIDSAPNGAIISFPKDEYLISRGIPGRRVSGA